MKIGVNLYRSLARSLVVSLQAVSKHLKNLVMIQKQGHWVSYKKPRDVEWRTWEQLLEIQKRKGFLHLIVTGNEK